MTGAGFSPLDASNIVAFIGDIFARRGAESYLGEDVTMSEHMLQGAMLAEQAGASDELVAAALLHDIGHYTNEFGPDAVGLGRDNYHETAGARVLEPFFPAIVTDCVRYHVAAKRYLCATDPGYYARLSQASKDTLALQGGPMDPDEVAAFSAMAHLEAIIQVRIWDEGGKVKGLITPPFEHYAPILQRVADRHQRARACG